jgi:hypothetical protein
MKVARVTRANILGMVVEPRSFVNVAFCALYLIGDLSSSNIGKISQL